MESSDSNPTRGIETNGGNADIQNVNESVINDDVPPKLNKVDMKEENLERFHDKGSNYNIPNCDNSYDKPETPSCDLFMSLTSIEHLFDKDSISLPSNDIACGFFNNKSVSINNLAELPKITRKNLKSRRRNNNYFVRNRKLGCSNKAENQMTKHRLCKTICKKRIETRKYKMKKTIINFKETEEEELLRKNKSLPGHNLTLVPKIKPDDKILSVCIYCGMKVRDIHKHLTIFHDNEKEVQLILSFSDNFLGVSSAFVVLINEGNFLEECEKIIFHNKNLNSTKKNNSLPCLKCLAFFDAVSLLSHLNKCPCNRTLLTKKSSSKSEEIIIFKKSEALLGAASNFKVESDFYENVVSKMKEDGVTKIYHSDSLILELGNFYFEKLGVNEVYLIEQAMRNISELLIEVRKLFSDSSISLESVLTSSCIDLLFNALRKINVLQEQKYSQNESFTLEIDVVHNLQVAAYLLWGIRLRSLKTKNGCLESRKTQIESIEDIKNFILSMETQWPEEFSFQQRKNSEKSVKASPECAEKWDITNQAKDQNLEEAPRIKDEIFISASSENEKEEVVENNYGFFQADFKDEGEKIDFINEGNSSTNSHCEHNEEMSDPLSTNSHNISEDAKPLIRVKPISLLSESKNGFVVPTQRYPSCVMSINQSKESNGYVVEKSSEVFQSKINTEKAPDVEKNSFKICKDTVFHCVYCSETTGNIISHFTLYHKDEVEVAHLLQLPFTDKNRSNEIALLIFEGNFAYNCRSLTLTRNGFSRSVKEGDEQDSTLGPCPSCLKFISKTYLLKHPENCPASGEECTTLSQISLSNSAPENFLFLSSALLGAISEFSHESAFYQILVSKKELEVLSRVCQNDTLLLEVGNFLLEKLGPSKTDEVWESVKLLSEVLMELRKIKSDTTTPLASYFSKSNFDLIINAISQVCFSKLKETVAVEPNVFVMNIFIDVRISAYLFRGITLRKINEVFESDKELLNIYRCSAKCIKDFIILLELRWKESIALITRNLVEEQMKVLIDQEKKLTTDILSSNSDQDSGLQNLQQRIKEERETAPVISNEFLNDSGNVSVLPKNEGIKTPDLPVFKIKEEITLEDEKCEFYENPSNLIGDKSPKLFCESTEIKAEGDLSSEIHLNLSPKRKCEDKELLIQEELGPTFKLKSRSEKIINKPEYVIEKTSPSVVTSKSYEKSVSSDLSLSKIPKKRKKLPGEYCRENSDVDINHATSKRMRMNIPDAPHQCVFCRKTALKMGTHLKNHHFYEFDVACLLDLPENAEERSTGFKLLVNEGDFSHNCKVRSTKKGEIIPAKEGKKEAKDLSITDYWPCSICLGFFHEKSLRFHFWRCPASPKNKLNPSYFLSLFNFQDPVIFESKALLGPSLSPNSDRDFSNNIISAMEADHVGNVCLSDASILEFGIFLYEQMGIASCDHIIRCMRILAKILIEVQSMDSSIFTSLSSVLSTKYFDLFVSAVKKICVVEKSAKNVLQKQMLAQEMGFHLRELAQILRGSKLRKLDSLKKKKSSHEETLEPNHKELRNFIELLRTEWNNKFSSVFCENDEKIESMDVGVCSENIVNSKTSSPEKSENCLFPADFLEVRVESAKNDCSSLSENSEKLNSKANLLFSSEEPHDMQDMQIIENFSEENEGDQISIEESKDDCEEFGNRFNFCLFCRFKTTKLFKHLQTFHGNEKEVQFFLSFPVKDVRRKKNFTLVCFEGDFFHSWKLRTGQKESNEQYKLATNGSNPGLTNSYSPCPFCLRFMNCSLLLSHKHNCPVSVFETPFKYNDQNLQHLENEDFIDQSNALLNFKGNLKPFSEAFAYIFSEAQMNDITNICKTDMLILEVGFFLTKKYGEEGSNYVFQSMKTLGQVVFQMKQLNSDAITSLATCLSPRYFDDLLSVVKQLCSTSTVKVLNVLLGNVGSLLKIAGSLFRCYCLLNMGLKSNDCETSAEIHKENNRGVREFLILMETDWKFKLLLAYPKVNVKETAMGILKTVASDMLPVTLDLLKLKEFLDSTIELLMKLVQRSKSKKVEKQKHWKRLCELTLIYLTLFNKTRNISIPNFCIHHFMKTQSRSKPLRKINPSLKSSLSSLELILVANMGTCVMTGQDKDVPILVPLKLENAIKVLINYRNYSGIPESNKIIFSSSMRSSTGYLKVHSCLKTLCKTFELPSIDLIISSKLKRFVCTAMQVMSLGQDECVSLADYLQEDVIVDVDLFEALKKAPDITKICSLLLVEEDGICSFSKKALSEITLEEIPVLLNS